MREYIRWSLTWGEKASALIQAAKDAGVPPPESAVPPPLPGYLEQYIRDFWVLSTCRQASMSGPGPIPWTALDQFAARNGYADDVVLYEDFMSYMMALDSEFIKVTGEEIERKQKQAEAQRGSGR